MTNPFPIQADENLHFIGPGQPFFRRRFPFGKAVAAGRAIPGNGIVVDESPFAIPQRRPLHTGEHPVVGEDPTYVGDGVLEDRAGFEVAEVFAIARKLNWAEDRVRVGSYHTGEKGFDGRRYEGRGCNGGRISDCGCVGDSG